MSIKERLGLDQDPLYLVDGSTFVYRAFYAFPDLKRSDGFPTNALFIVMRLLLKILREEDPKYLGFFLDGRDKHFRHELLPSYKAQRQATPEGLGAQIEPLKRAVELMGLFVHTSQGGEADDCLASLAWRFKAERPVVIVGSDKDLNQCLDDNVFIWDPGARTEKLATVDSFRQEFGMEPAHWPDYQALVGDSSDNIPGVPGVGPKTARGIIERLPTLEDIRDRVAELKPAERKKIEPHLSEAFTYRELTRLSRSMCPDVGLADLRRLPLHNRELAQFMKEFEFRSLESELPSQREEYMPLLGMAPAADQLRQTREVREVRSDELTGPLDPAGREVGLVLEEGSLYLGLNGEDLRVTGSIQALARALRQAALIATPSLKELLSLDEAFAHIPNRAWLDLGLGAYLLDPEGRDYSWAKLKDTLPLATSSDPLGLGATRQGVREGRGTLALELARALSRRIEEAGLGPLLRDLETPLIPVLVHMEKRGVCLDIQAFKTLLDEVSQGIERLGLRIHELAGQPFNIRSSQQLAQILFDRLGLAPVKTAGRTPGGARSTASGVLERLTQAHPIVAEVLEFRKLDKLRSTYLEPLPRLVDRAGRIHTTFNQLATATGRLSSSSPNLQNIPIRGEQGRRMRACFVAGEGNMLAAADYSQIELRLLADMAQDPALLEAFRLGEDIHRRTAALLFDKAPDQVTGDERRSAKTINFGLLYGMGPQRLSRELSVPLAQAKEFIDRYFSRLAHLKEFYEQVVDQAKAQGFVTTIAGRRRMLPDIHSKNQNLAETARRQAINTRVQGSAADFIKLAMLSVESDQDLASLGARLILQVHDELLVEAPAGSAEAAGARLAEIMRTVCALSVPVVVDWGVGRSWGQAH